jgi:hypothetical protein
MERNPMDSGNENGQCFSLCVPPVLITSNPPSQISTVSAMTRLRTGHPWNRVSIFSRDKRFFSSSELAERLWSLYTLILNK